MKTGERIVQFAVSNEAGEFRGGAVDFVPERKVGSGDVIAWIAIAATLWSVIVISAFAI
jgi:hypothetical protein